MAATPLPLTSLPLTPWRRMTLLLGVPAALIAIGWTALTAVAWAGQGSFPVHFRDLLRGSNEQYSGCD